MTQDISKLILKKQEEDKKKQQEAEVARLNTLINELYEWFFTKELTVKDVHSILVGMTKALDDSMLAKTQPITTAEMAKSLKDFYDVKK